MKCAGKDLRTWWRKGMDADYYLYRKWGTLGAISDRVIYDSDSRDCIAEQQWAKAEGMA